jgi:hypothetical protein
VDLECEWWRSWVAGLAGVVEAAGLAEVAGLTEVAEVANVAEVAEAVWLQRLKRLCGCVVWNAWWVVD